MEFMMSRPVSKSHPLNAMQTEHNALVAALEEWTEKQIPTVNRTTRWSNKVLPAHLTDWEQMVIGWNGTVRKGRIPAVPSKKDNWAQLPALNKEILEKHRAKSLKTVLAKFHASFAEIRETVKGIREADLFTPGRFAWTKTVILGSYFVSCTSSHYAWPRKEIRKCLK
jgi:hypothetical protein